MRYAALPTLFCLLSTWIGLQTLQSASATINEHQERQAEIICTLNPERCGLPRYDATIR
jgi:hypothetical protein